MTTYYILIVEYGTEPSTEGPFPNAPYRDSVAKRLWKEISVDVSNNLFWLDIDDKGCPHVGAYAASELR